LDTKRFPNQKKVLSVREIARTLELGVKDFLNRISVWKNVEPTILRGIQVFAIFVILVAKIVKEVVL
jgi:hypothetical protein